MPAARIDRHRFGNESRAWRDAFLEGGREHEGLERGAGLALALDGKVELALAEDIAAEHRQHEGAARVDRHQVRRGPRRVREPLADRVPGDLLQLQVDLRIDLEPTAEDP